MKYIFYFFILLASISACSPEEETNAALTYWASNNTEEIAFARDAVERWNADHPSQTIHYQPVPEGQSSEEIILAAVVGKTTPDVYANMWQGDVELYAQAGALVPLDTLDGFLDFLKNRCDSLTIAEVTAQDGHIYQIPWKVNPIMMMYNVNIFRKIGFENPPRTYAEFLAAAEKIKQDANGDGYTDHWIGYTDVAVVWWQRLFNFYPLYLAASNGGRLVTKDQAAFDNKYAVEVFDFLQTLYKENYFPKQQMRAQSDPFLAGLTAVKFTGPWDVAYTDKYKPEGFQYALAPMPVPDAHEGPVYTYCDPKNIVIFSTCKNPELAWQFLQTMLDETGDLSFLQLSNQIPRRKDLLENPAFIAFFEKNPKLKPFAEQSRYLRGVDSSPVMKEVFDLISQEYEASVIYGVKSPQQSVQDAAQAVDLLFLK